MRSWRPAWTRLKPAHRGATARLLLQNGLADRDFPSYDALARGRAGGVLYRAGHTLDLRVVAAGALDRTTPVEDVRPYAAVAELLGLSYDHFTKCVLLPQGEFAAFLRAEHAKWAKVIGDAGIKPQ